MRWWLAMAGSMAAISIGAAHAQAVSSGMISTREHRMHVTHVGTPVQVAAAPHRSRAAVASNRRAVEPETTGSIANKKP